MATQRVKNVSNTDREVPTPDGGYVIVERGHSHEFDSEHAKSLLTQSDVWEKYVSSSTKPKAKRSTSTRTPRRTVGDEVVDDEPTMTDAEHGEALDADDMPDHNGDIVKTPQE